MEGYRPVSRGCCVQSVTDSRPSDPIYEPAGMSVSACGLTLDLVFRPGLSETAIKYTARASLRWVVRTLRFGSSLEDFEVWAVCAEGRFFCDLSFG